MFVPAFLVIHFPGVVRAKENIRNESEAAGETIDGTSQLAILAGDVGSCCLPVRLYNNATTNDILFLLLVPEAHLLI